MTEPNAQDASSGFNPTREQLNMWYEQYAAYTEAQRAAILRITLMAESRRNIAQEPTGISLEDFEKMLQGMEPANRSDYLLQLEAGYEATYQEALRRASIRRGGPGGTLPL